MPPARWSPPLTSPYPMSGSSAQLDHACPRCRYPVPREAETCPECGLAEPASPGAALAVHARPWLHRFAIGVLAATFILVTLGGTVTSRQAGLSVPDWPTSYGYNMFLFPPSMWQGGIFWEHVHRLMGSLVGLLTIALALWIWLTQAARPWLRWMGWVALGLVIVQGIFGGLRVTQISTPLAVVHGVLGQVFLAVLVLLAAATGRTWIRAAHRRRAGGLRALRIAGWLLMAILLIQLILGASMRHTGSGLAIPDFPASYGRLVPPLTESGIREAIDARPYETFTAYYHPAQVAVHFAHRAWALVVVAASVTVMVMTGRRVGPHALTRGPLGALAAMLLLQLALGASVIWSTRHPEIATAHQALGAALLATAFLLTLRLHLLTPGDALPAPGSATGAPESARPALAAGASPR